MRQRHTDIGHVRMGTDTGVMHLQANNTKEPPAARSSTAAWDRVSLTASRVNQHYQHLDVRLLGSRTVNQSVAVVLSFPVCGMCYSRPRKLT